MCESSPRESATSRSTSSQSFKQVSPAQTARFAACRTTLLSPGSQLCSYCTVGVPSACGAGLPGGCRRCNSALHSDFYTTLYSMNYTVCSMFYYVILCTLLKYIHCMIQCVLTMPDHARPPYHRLPPSRPYLTVPCPTTSYPDPILRWATLRCCAVQHAPS